jgi:hypothetical protein
MKCRPHNTRFVDYIRSAVPWALHVDNTQQLEPWFPVVGETNWPIVATTCSGCGSGTRGEGSLPKASQHKADQVLRTTPYYLPVRQENVGLWVLIGW